MAEIKDVHLRGSIAGFAFDITVTSDGDEAAHIIGTAGDKPCDLTLSVRDDGFNLSGLFLGKECIVNASKVFS